MLNSPAFARSPGLVCRSREWMRYALFMGMLDRDYFVERTLKRMGLMDEGDTLTPRPRKPDHSAAWVRLLGVVVGAAALAALLFVGLVRR